MLEFFYQVNPLNQIKILVGETPLLGDIAVWANNRVKGTLKTNPSYWISRVITSPLAQIVQIGSNDGKFNDPLKRLLKTRRNWKALFVEPVPYLFDRLKANYGTAERFAYENAAINDGRSAKFFWVDESAKSAFPNLPPWYDQLGSFDRNHILKHLPQLESFIRETEVVGITLSDLFDKHQLTSIDVLHIDTEGHDFKILSQLDLKKFQPTIVLYEHQHLSPDEKRASISFLKPDYEIFEWGADMFAVSRLAGETVRSTLRSLDSYRVTDR